MLRDQSFSKRLVKCYAVIDGSSDVLDVVNINAEFTLNGIPAATATLALGRDVNSNKAVAAAINDKFLFRKGIKIYAAYKEQSTSGVTNPIPQFDSKLIFDGYIAGFGFQRTAGAAVLTISMEHWLSDLSASTMLSTGTHYATPADLQRAALFKNGPSAEFTQGGKPAFLAASWMINAAGGVGGLCDDFWESGLKKILNTAATTDNLADLNRQTLGSCTEADILNKAASSALKKITSTGAPLKITLLDAQASDVGRSIVNDISNVYLENLAGQTLWDCLIACSGNYMFAVIPHVESAEVVPFCPVAVGKNKKPFKTITADQADSISVSGDCPRTLRGVAIVFPQNVQPFAGPHEQPLPPDLTMGGVYINQALGCKGTMLFKHPPSWLSIDYSYFAGSADKNSLGGAPNPQKLQPPSKKSVGEMIKEYKGIRDAYAKCVYGLEVIKGRQGTISGPLRFDIGVGSQIKFEIPEDYHLPDAGDNKYFYGVVVRVSYSIDANSSVASTVYNVAHIRTHAEEANSSFTLAEHPLYDNVWIGSELDKK